MGGLAGSEFGGGRRARTIEKLVDVGVTAPGGCDGSVGGGRGITCSGWEDVWSCHDELISGSIGATETRLVG